MDGGRLKWEKEGRPMTREVPSYTSTGYPVPQRDDKRIRIFRDQVLRHVEANRPLVDVRSPDEFSGERLHMPEYPNEGALRGGHIPRRRQRTLGAGDQPRGRHLQGRRRAAQDLRGGDQAQAQRRRGRLLPYRRAEQPHLVRAHLPPWLPAVRNYDGSWTEWGNLVGAPIER